MNRRDISNMYQTGTFGVRVPYEVLHDFLDALGDEYFRWSINLLPSPSPLPPSAMTEEELQKYASRENEGEEMCVLFFSGSEIIGVYAKTTLQCAGYPVFEISEEMGIDEFSTKQSNPMPEETLLSLYV